MQTLDLGAQDSILHFQFECAVEVLVDRNVEPLRPSLQLNRY
jgi:hypothetical protein